MRASRLAHMEVENAAGQNVGEIEDLVIDMTSGRVQSVVLEVENPGRNDRLHAYRLRDFRAGAGRKLVLNVDPEALRKTRGFAEYAWPAWNDPYWTSEPGMRLMRAGELMNKEIRDRNGAKAGEIRDLVIDLRSGAVTHAILDLAKSRREARVPMRELGLAPSGEPMLDIERAQLADRAATEMRASRLIDMEVENRQGRNLGEVEDLVIDLPGARVQFAVLELENVFDLGRKLFAYRLTDFSTGGGRRLILDVDPAQLRQARGFSEDSWPRWSDAYWASYQSEPGGRPLPGMALEAQASAGGTARTVPLMRARELIGKQVRDRNGNRAGEIEDLIVDLRNGAITHAIIDLEGTLQQARVPIDVLAMDADGELTLGVDREQRR